MNKQDIENTKKELVDDLKENLESTMLEDFVENYEDWKRKMDSVNDVIAHVDELVEPYKFNDFCKKIIDVTKDSLENNVEYDKLFLNNSEYAKIAIDFKGDKQKMEAAVLDELHKKYTKYLTMVLNKQQLKESVRAKLKDKFEYVEGALDASLEMAQSILYNDK